MFSSKVLAIVLAWTLVAQRCLECDLILWHAVALWAVWMWTMSAWVSIILGWLDSVRQPAKSGVAKSNNGNRGIISAGNGSNGGSGAYDTNNNVLIGTNSNNVQIDGNNNSNEVNGSGEISVQSLPCQSSAAHNIFWCTMVATTVNTPNFDVPLASGRFCKWFCQYGRQLQRFLWMVVKAVSHVATHWQIRLCVLFGIMQSHRVGMSGSLGAACLQLLCFGRVDMPGKSQLRLLQHPLLSVSI